jgi:hypothetical protein
MSLKTTGVKKGAKILNIQSDEEQALMHELLDKWD